MGRRKNGAAERAEAEEYLARYLAGSEPRLRWLREEAARTGGPTPDQLDFSRDSLVPLWTWAIGRFRLRPEDDPLDLVEQGLGRYYMPRTGTVPMWYGRRPIQAPHAWSDDTLALIDGLVYYLAECLLRAVPGARWQVFHATERNHVDEGQPVLTGGPAPLELLLPMMSLAGRVYRVVREDAPNPYGIPAATPEDLRQWFDDLAAPGVPATDGPAGES